MWGVVEQAILSTSSQMINHSYVLSASERRGNNFNDFRDFCLKATARIWPCLSYTCRQRSKDGPSHADDGDGDDVWGVVEDEVDAVGIEQTWHTKDSHSQILALADRQKS